MIIYVAVFGVLLLLLAITLLATSALLKRGNDEPARPAHNHRPPPLPAEEQPTVISLAPQRVIQRPYSVWPDDGGNDAA